MVLFEQFYKYAKTHLTVNEVSDFCGMEIISQ